MAKSDAFFLRGIVTSNGSTYEQAEIDLGAYVNLGVKSSTLLRIHSISAQITDSDSVADSISGASALKIGHQLTTQSQSALVTADDKSLVCSGSMQTYVTQVAPDGSVVADFATGFATHDFDVAPQMFVKGMLIGVDSLFLAVDQNGTFASGNVNVAYVMECTLESATQSSAVALSLSQT